MLQEKLRRIYALVGEITTEFNNLEQLWYLIFTCLLHPAERAAMDIVFNQHKTGGGQRKMISEVAAALKLQLDTKLRAEKRDDLSETEKLPYSIFGSIIELCEVTNTLAGRRNQVAHSLIYVAEFSFPPSVSVAGISKPSALAGKEVEQELRNLLADIEYHAIDLEQLRFNAITWIHPTMNVEHERQRIESLRREIANKHPRRV